MNEVVNILLVDDELRNLDALEAILESPGYCLLRATNADAALRHLLDHDVAAIVLDIKMPGVSGFELAQLIKGTRRYRQIPIVFLTAYLVDDRDVLAGYGAGAVDYLTKPVHPQILRHKIEVFADLFRKTRALALLNDTLETRVQERTAELERSEAALRAANQQKDAFIATLAHELRNPLAPLRTGVDYLVRLPNQTPNAIRVIGAMNRQLNHMVRLIDDLLDVSRITRGVLELHKEVTDLATIIEQAIETSQPFLKERGQSLQVSVGERCAAEVDVTRVSQIIGNLLHNASKYSPAGAEIRVELARVGADAVVRVIDAGAGIPAEQLDRVFDMFARIERALPNANGGLGIGLALARRLAQLHGGTLDVRSEGEGRGATFTLTLPGARRALAPGASPAAGGEAEVGAPLRIVVIEDTRDVGETLVMWLEGLGHEVHLAASGLDGVSLVRAVQPDLVFCDIGLPDVSGFEVCEQIRGLALKTRPVMIALTGWGTEEDRRRAEAAGFDHHLVKPVAPANLEEVLQVHGPAGSHRDAR